MDFNMVANHGVEVQDAEGTPSALDQDNGLASESSEGTVELLKGADEDLESLSLVLEEIERVKAHVKISHFTELDFIL